MKKIDPILSSRYKGIQFWVGDLEVLKKVFTVSWKEGIPRRSQVTNYKLPNVQEKSRIFQKSQGFLNNFGQARLVELMAGACSEKWFRFEMLDL